MRFTCRINGVVRTIDTHPLRRLLDILRDDLGLTGTKEGCGEGECGACAVLLEDVLVNSCMVPAMHLRGKSVLSIEGIGVDGPDALQRAFVEEGAVQCGFCTPGMILAARALLLKGEHPSRDAIRDALSGNLCRCTGYEQIFRAVEKASREGYGAHCRRHLVPVDPSYSLDRSERSWCFLPDTLEEALSVLASRDERPLVFAGGTDIFPDMKNEKVACPQVLDLSAIASLKKIHFEKNDVLISACVPVTRIAEDPALNRTVKILCDAARSIGAPAVRNRATIGGNLANASAAADLPVPLLVLGAKVHARNESQEKIFELEDFYESYRSTKLGKDELITAISFPLPPEGAVQEFHKRGSRATLTLSRMSLAFLSSHLPDGGYDIRIAAGSMSPVPFRLKRTEAYIRHHPMTAETLQRAIDVASGEINPRKSGEYRRYLSLECMRKHLQALENA
jgi:carbon-monoxide dehydrogenase small subunit/xanthine dehydrogenase small subunit